MYEILKRRKDNKDSKNKKMVAFKKDGKYNHMFEFTNREQVEEKYGGNAPNLKQGEYFPPRFIDFCRCLLQV